nr:hypothetical protein Itr_chr06CG10320 [Ipomoea trifida]GMD03505.1 hypothetical protein Iba_chr06aCG9530 [Ipomoea batatas]
MAKSYGSLRSNMRGFGHPFSSSTQDTVGADRFTTSFGRFKRHSFRFTNPTTVRDAVGWWRSELLPKFLQGDGRRRGGQTVVFATLNAVQFLAKGVDEPLHYGVTDVA